MLDPPRSALARRMDLTRRQLLVVAGAMGLAALLHSPPSADASETTRLATLAALLAAVACGPAAGMTEGVISAYVDRYSAYYAEEADPYFCAYADAALDEIAATGIGLLDPPTALAEIGSWAEDGQHAARAAAALDLTKLVFEEHEAQQVGYALTRS
jgi:hypothetical protein